MRVFLAAVALCAISFVAGIAGDLSQPANSGASVTLRIPPPIPADAPRARPLISTPAAVAAEPPAGRVTPLSQTFAAPPAPEEPRRASRAKQRNDRVLVVVREKPDPRSPPKKGG
ncbi:MAG TPA: hypothetical protein PLK37_06935 [Terricaulis sp.]|nr:hypothetical protein [Terricaulis sp.]